MAGTAATPAPVAVDTMGGDHAPREIVAGAVEAVRRHGVELVLVGQASKIRAELDRHGFAGKIPIVHAEEALAMDEGALASWRKPRSSVAVGCLLIRQNRASALVSAGTTAGVVVTSRLRLRAQHGVMRPAIAVTLPTRPRPTVLLDAGATADVKPETLVQFAALGTAYAQIALGVDRPRVGLLTIGTEPGKGNKVTRRAHELLTAAHEIEFAGNVEGHDLLRGRVDVVVTDGFTGNVALKSMEGAMKLALAEVRATITSTRMARLGALLQKRRLEELKARFAYETYGGGVLLGLNGTVVIAHGSSSAPAITSACVLARDLAAGRIVDRIREQIGATRAPRFGRRPHGEREQPEREIPARERHPAEGPTGGQPSAPPPAKPPAAKTPPPKAPATKAPAAKVPPTKAPPTKAPAAKGQPVRTQPPGEPRARDVAADAPGEHPAGERSPAEHLPGERPDA